MMLEISDQFFPRPASVIGRGKKDFAHGD